MKLKASSHWIDILLKMNPSPNDMEYLIVFSSSLLVVLFAIPFFVRLANKLDFLDYPSSLKIHMRPTPLLGGVAV
jgi:UDP-N-acetylmuramyl pentapeptide phosphotransferase/UDP-N-acetylglucosamine-1-phosphate transferase